MHLTAAFTRRAFLGRNSRSLGALALGSLLCPSLARAGDGGVVQAPHVPPRAKRVIWLTMAGGPSHLETLDPKPAMAALDGQPMPESITAGQPIAQLQGAKLTVLAPQHPFQACGESGLEISSIFTELAKVADHLCIVRSLRTEAINHDPAQTLMNTGATISGRPSAGSWVLYGLGSESDSLPGFVVLTSLGGHGQGQPIAARQWHCGFLPSNLQGVEFHSKGDPVLYVGRPAGATAEQQRDIVEAAAELNRQEDAVVDDPEIATRISQYELAFRMQTSVPDLMNVADEPAHILDLYGTKGADGSFAGNCLLARRLAERGVRFVQLYHRGWDHHDSVKDRTKKTAAEVDRASAALLIDLEQRGMLEDTLVIWGGEFGRTPMAQGNGRDHHIKGFSMWLAGGGIRPGIAYGATDEFGYNAVENIVHVHDLHATILHLLGIDHLKLTYPYQGRQFRLTDVSGEVVGGILA
jgi:uncharacterized protein (DUF1501 family)